MKYNNIHDFTGSSPLGCALYNDDYNYTSIYATENYWGTAYPDSWASSLFYQGGGAVTYSPWETGAIIDDGEEDLFETAMIHWDRGEFADAAELLCETAQDSGAVGMNSVRYLLGCEGELESRDYTGLRRWFLSLADECRDARVAKAARRCGTHCLTKVGDYEAALREFDQARENAESFVDSLTAALDWLAVYELASGSEVNAAGESVAQRMSKLTALMKDHDARRRLQDQPGEFALAEIYPNPFNSFARIAFAVPEAGMVRLAIYDLNGRLIQTLLDGERYAGAHTAVWDASAQPSGVYLARLEAANRTTSRKLTLVK